ncbi:hypothetical protein [Saccharopolyspora rosea]|uniref:IrrE N-terminal-like domain-containing protein n=1 Tax=Saccharopolyspora rosea TaxID=524884 RepID=A0ABW3FQ15_9PSEU|nr:hypothetical protein [Saccharopolyspora rosea]
MDWARVRADCRLRVAHLLRGVELPNPWDVNEFLDRLERHRGRDIDLCAVAWTAGESTGAWQRRADHDVIVYPVNTSPLHQDHIILHEVGHLVSDHSGRCVLSVREAQRRAPHLAPAAFAHLLDRAAVQAEEHEAETIATMLLARITRQRRRRRPFPPPDAPTEATVTRLNSVFDQP